LLLLRPVAARCPSAPFLDVVAIYEMHVLAADWRSYAHGTAPHTNMGPRTSARTLPWCRHVMAPLARRDGSTQPRLPHAVPPWIDGPVLYFLTCCTAPRGHNQLCRPDVAGFVKTSLEYHQGRYRCRLHACVLMPDHLHLLTNLVRLMTNWKRLVARSYGVGWQRDFFEHRLRRDEHFDAKVDYMRQNPVRAGLVSSGTDWPYFWVW